MTPVPWFVAVDDGFLLAINTQKRLSHLAGAVPNLTSRRRHRGGHYGWQNSVQFKPRQIVALWAEFWSRTRNVRNGMWELVITADAGISVTKYLIINSSQVWIHKSVRCCFFFEVSEVCLMNVRECRFLARLGRMRFIWVWISVSH